MSDTLHPFEILKLIRDGVVTNISQLEAYPSSIFLYGLRLKLGAMASLGWIHMDDDGGLRPTPQLNRVQEALGLSLTQLAPYSSSAIVTNPVFGDIAAPPRSYDVFVLMPFSPDLRPVYEDHIQAVAERLDVQAGRADDFFAANAIIQDIWNAINDATVLIADCTGRNPNVFYELGIAHTLGKPVILVAQNLEDIPFDIGYMRVIEYALTPRGMRDFEEILERTLRFELERPRSLTDHVLRSQ